jgi:beta-galactosidase
MKDQYNSLLPQRQPGYLVDPLQGRVEQFYALEGDSPVSGQWGTGQASLWAEQLKSLAPDTQVLLSYGKINGWLDDQPAVITHACGKGRITYIGAVLDDHLMVAATEWMVKQSGVKPVFGPVPDGVEVSRREGAGKLTYILINFAKEDRRVPLPHAMKLLLADRTGDSVTLPPYGVELLQDAH